MAHGPHDQIKKIIKVSRLFLFILGLVAQRPKALTWQKAQSMGIVLEGSRGNLVSGIGKREHISRQVTFIHVYQKLLLCFRVIVISLGILQLGSPLFRFRFKHECRQR